MKGKTDASAKGRIFRVSGPVVIAEGIDARMHDLMRVGKEQLMGEVIQINPDKITIQVYEDTSGIKPDEPVENTGQPLIAELGPGLLTSIYDGIQRPLPVLQSMMGDYILRGAKTPGLDRKKKWHFKPVVKKGEDVKEGQIIGTVKETNVIEHKVMVPPGVSGKIKAIEEGDFTVEETVASLANGRKLTMMQIWPIRKSRPCKEKLTPEIPLITGQRILDALFPLAKGGAGGIPGPFGSGKTVTQQQLAKWSDADIVVYIGCGERGNEMTEVLKDFPKLIDPKTNRPLMERTVLIANTSNMPVAAREASIYTGITIAEYYRDMGYDVALMADSTSRWAEAMREISSRLEEMPGEEGYPAYLSARLAEFYERAGRVKPLGVAKIGSVSIIGAVSPPGGDLSEPVTQSTLRVVKTFWALDAKLAHRRHFPSINWLNSYSLYETILEPWYTKNVAADWKSTVNECKKILQEEDKLQEIVQLVGSDALPENEQLTLEIARMIREFFLQQSAYHEVDTFCDLRKSYKMMKSILHYADKARYALKAGVHVRNLLEIKARNRIADAKFEKNHEKILSDAEQAIDKEIESLLMEIK
ncbi:MAG: V-type ATP synthase subunit A [Candidatus Aenigmarchaeota archaeon]|nr:V-type ATP synthase subunit A [Candidatus Aenigmarchaeota archaeon]